MRIKILEDGHASSLPLEHHVERLALEANVLTNAIDSLVNFMPAITDKFKNLVASFNADSTDHNRDVLLSVKEDAWELSISVSYSDIAGLDRTLITVPEGFDGNLFTYASDLLTMNARVYSMTDDAINELNMYLSKFISNAEVKSSGKDITKNIANRAKEREIITKSIGKYFSDKHVKSKAYLADVCGRLPEIQATYEKTMDLVDVTTVNKVKALESKVQETANLLELVYTTLVEDGKKIHGNAAMNISKTSYEVAKCVELVGMYNFRVAQLSGCVALVVKDMRYILKNKKPVKL